MKDQINFLEFCSNRGLQANKADSLKLFIDNRVFQNTRSGDFVLEDELNLQWSDKYGCYVDLEAKEELYQEVV